MYSKPSQAERNTIYYSQDRGSTSGNDKFMYKKRNRNYKHMDDIWELTKDNQFKPSHFWISDGSYNISNNTQFDDYLTDKFI
jgi:hypothetical protein